MNSNPRTEARWIVFTDASSLADCVVAALRESGAEPICVAKGDSFQKTADDSYVVTIPPTQRATMAALRRDCLRRKLFVLILQLWPLAATQRKSKRKMNRPELASTRSRKAVSTHCAARLRGYRRTTVADVGGHHGRGGHHRRRISDTGDELADGKPRLGQRGVLGNSVRGISCRFMDVVVPAAGNAKELDSAECILAEAELRSSDCTVAYFAPIADGFRRWSVSSSTTRPA